MLAIIPKYDDSVLYTYQATIYNFIQSLAVLYTIYRKFTYISLHTRVLNDVERFQLREMDVVPLLLDCCNIDARNPRK